ncbi:MAG TPA: HlyD family efflux transporter periplasmic adaptor subunit [Geminicoccaceae bacterium]|nr:HlyD family efflux transporter periplasmic adaptor subunit [Geminicoccus sp.]HMU48810.1 HlyD family efflux transporter periplasmic adaptor subunit [Geminicoccaceae bacterium]
MAEIMAWLQGLLLAIGIGGTARDGTWVQGYAEGEQIRVAAPLEGELAMLAVERGAAVEAGAPLFALDPTIQLAARDEALARLRRAEADLADLRKGERDEELAAIEARQAQAQADLVLAEQRLRRQEELVRSSASARDRLDEATAQAKSDRALVDQLVAELAVARLGARSDRIAAAGQEVAAATAALAGAEHLLAELAPTAPVAARVEDTHFRPGERVPAGRPVVSLLPPGNIKLRFFVPQVLLSRLSQGAQVGWTCDGCPPDLAATVGFVSGEAEFTPPVIYSIGSRDKLVFMVEARPAAGFLPRPGQPVDVRLPGP